MSKELTSVAREMEAFEASPSQANTGTGSRREGEGFELLARRFWRALHDGLLESGARALGLAHQKGRYWAALGNEGRVLYLPMSVDGSKTSIVPRPSTWFTTEFLISDQVATYPGTLEAIERYAPATGPYADASYPEMFAALTTRFDDTVVLEDDGVLHHKILLEYKSAKSSTKRQVDGNAHERLTFQAMQYLEVAPRYTRCSFLVISNGAWIRYRNKYHVSFHVQADRLANFTWFRMMHACTADQFLKQAKALEDWLMNGQRHDFGGTP